MQALDNDQHTLDFQSRRRQRNPPDDESEPSDSDPDADLSSTMSHPPLKRQRMDYILVPPAGPPLVLRHTHRSNPTGISSTAAPLLSEAEWHSVPSSVVMSQDTCAAFKYIIGINLDDVPGRTRKGRGTVGR